MPRPSQLLHPARPPTPTRDAATVLLLRDTSDGLEVLMTRRSSNASFVPGAYVFPGGGIDAADACCHALAQRRAAQSAQALTEAIAAIRESFEELGILLARHADGNWATQAEIDAMDRQGELGAQCAARGLTLAASDMFVLARWITDRDLPKRFDVPFLVARVPPGQTPVADETEQFEPVWVRPADALARHQAGSFFMIYPTIITLERLQKLATVDAVLQVCAVSEEPLWTSCPRTGLLAGREQRHMEHESAYGELALVCPDGQIVHPLDWQSEHPVALLKNVLRLTAPNPGAMTGPGTNSYLVGDPSTGYIAIDPGPADDEHLAKLWRAAGGDIRLIVCTHSHPDHAPGARPLQAMCDTVPPILGLASAETARANSAFTPDRALLNHERLTLSRHGGISSGVDFSRPWQTEACPTAEDTRHTLQVIHTPGHAANHLCLMLLEDGLLFSGDHILNGSTTVVDPPDGDMSDYLNSLDLLHAACTEHQLKYILPAHGYVIGGPDDEAKVAITRLKAHRLQREAKVLAAMQAQPDGTLDDWLALVYADVPQRMWPVAKRSLMAHVARITSLMP
ncbi:MBL fold metallo-hydrolase [Rhodoferax sp.]|uniref:MBL fold metallo-hydrolase n=1 Tax=Rhodoferax sp. TaxID=50421 RepID=UPI0027306298|nr:MBL fold metallo-hydrolase [Rhodoferax sp.]MDP1529955.1 MBL fold metallo-hydrolase [Rhodoferax sp.]MDP1942728.1 MBL fold metallo-hydrolase [Rhodoferax sp.]MDP2443457.1 MBL fold metallo-hydrolase [Rhodoferax sp.]MDZ4206294.1 MBL fold metallo-hydrolase [Rhodoferax sp.]